MDSSVWGYFGFAVGVTVLAYGLMIISALVLGFLGYEFHGFGIFLAFIGGFVAFFAVIGWTARWSIKLVAIAMRRNSLTMSDFLSMTAGNHWRIIGLYFLFLLLAMLIGLASLAVAFVVAKIGSPVLSMAFGGVELLVTWLQTIMAITMLTALYAFFVEDRNLA
jgi:hypothetical protein